MISGGVNARVKWDSGLVEFLDLVFISIKSEGVEEHQSAGIRQASDANGMDGLVCLLLCPLTVILE